MDYKVTELIEELRNDTTWCEDDSKREKMIALLKKTIETTY